MAHTPGNRHLDPPEKDEGRTTPPYAAYRTFANFLRSLKQVIPNRIDKSAMRSMSGGAQAQVLHALKYLQLIDAKGAPRSELVELVRSEGTEHQHLLLEVLQYAYPFLEANTIDLSNATHQQLEEEFRKLASGDTVRKCIAFFIPAAKEAGIVLSPFIKEPGRRSPSNGRAKKSRQKAPTNDSTPSINAEASPRTGQPQQSWHEMLLSKFPTFDPSWNDEIKANWFKSFNDLMQRGKQ